MHAFRSRMPGIAIVLVSFLAGCASNAAHCNGPLQRINTAHAVPPAANAAASQALERRP